MNDWPKKISEHLHRDEMRCRGDSYRDDPCHCNGSLPDYDPQQHDKLGWLFEVLRRNHGKPLKIVSGYRCPDHPIEKAKDHPGAHASGLAFDLSVETGGEKLMLVTAAIMWASLHNDGNLGVGLQQSSKGSRLHLDIAPWRDGLAFWTY